jgi:transposase-like protein
LGFQDSRYLHQEVKGLIKFQMEMTEENSMKIKHCPNKSCEYHKNPIPKFYYKHGSYTTKRGIRTERFKCRGCGKTFAENINDNTYGQQKPDINRMLFHMLCSGMTLRRIARTLEVCPKTVQRRIDWLTPYCMERHVAFLEAVGDQLHWVQFDEMETCESTKLKPLSIPLIIHPKTQKILGFDVAAIGAKGHLAKTYNEVYQYPRINETRESFNRLFEFITRYCKNIKIIMTDQKPAYIKVVEKYFPEAEHVAILSRKKAEKKITEATAKEERETKEGKDKMFILNHFCARLRADIAALRRRTWSVCKKPSNLAQRLLIYTCYTNKTLDY